MKKLFIIIALSFSFIYSCTKDEITPKTEPSGKDTIKTVISNLKFKIAPIATDQFKISIPGESGEEYKLSLRKGKQELLSYELNDETGTLGLFSATIKYNFSSNDIYNILIHKFRENADTVFQENCTLPEYVHKYYGNFNYETLASIHQRLDFDVSPSRNVIFYNDYINNKCVLKRLAITDKKLEVIDDDFFSLLIRSKNDNQLIVSTKNYNNHFLGADSCALLNYDINTHDTSFIDWGSDDYGRFSRVVNNSLMVSNPVLTNSISLIDLSDNSKRKYTADIRYLREYSFDQIYLGNDIFDFSNFSFASRLPILNSNTSIVYYDENSQYLVTAEYLNESQSSSTYYSRMVIFKNDEIVYEQPFEKGRTFNFPCIINLDDNKLVFYQYYDYDSILRYDGYYLLDLVKKEITPLQYESELYQKYDFFNSNDKSSFISIRPSKIFKVTMN